MRAALASALALVVGAAGCDPADVAAPEGDASGGGGGGGAPAAWQWDLPPGFPEPIVPDDNPMSAAKVELGRHLFFDRRLSFGETQSCATCHQPQLAFTDGRARALLASGEAHPRSAPSLANVAFASALGWANPVLVRLEAHAVVPLFGTDPEELGWSGRERQLEARLAAVPRYVALFAEAFPEEEPIRIQNVVRGLASFQRTILSGGSAFDRHLQGDTQALDAAARRGLALFESEALACSRCHSGWATTDAVIDTTSGDAPRLFHNTGLYDVGGTGAYPATSTGLHEATGRAEDMGKFRAPTLRNVAVTAPYMHDGSDATLDEVLDHYARGGRLIEEGPDAGDGHDNRYKSELVDGFPLDARGRADLLVFLHALTDPVFLGDPRLGDPWPDARDAGAP